MYRKWWMVLAVMALISPLGLLAEGGAWGEWGTEEIQAMLGFVPIGIDRAQRWSVALLPDYSLALFGEGSLASGMGYIVSAFVGAGLVMGVTFLYVKILSFPRKTAK